MKSVHVLIAWAASVVGVACTDSEFAREPEYVDQFSVRIADEDLTAAIALVNLNFYRDGRVAVDLSFEAVREPARTSLVLQPSIEQLSQGTFEAELVDGPLLEGRGNWFVDGEAVSNGIVRVSVQARGSLSGSTIGTTPEMEFSGKYALSCAVPPASLGRSEDSVPVPVGWDGNSRSLSLVVDEELSSRECDDASRAVGWR
ncbi:MAG: hypothetical protein ABI895_31815 [Deltaproteobacteria bacterium]